MQPLPQTLEFAKYVILFTTFPTPAFHAASVLEWYRRRWQVELVFKRFKSLAQLGHLPKRDDESARAWLYGKLLVTLLVEKLIRHARHFPLGIPLGNGRGRAAPGATFSSGCSRSHTPLHRRCRYHSLSTSGIRSPRGECPSWRPTSTSPIPARTAAVSRRVVVIRTRL